MPYSIALHHGILSSRTVLTLPCVIKAVTASVWLVTAKGGLGCAGDVYLTEHLPVTTTVFAWRI